MRIYSIHNVLDARDWILFDIPRLAQQHLLRASSLWFVSTYSFHSLCFMQIHCILWTHNNIMQNAIIFLVVVSIFSFQWNAFVVVCKHYSTVYIILYSLQCILWIRFFSTTLLKTHYVYHYKNLGSLQTAFFVLFFFFWFWGVGLLF